MIEFLNGNGKHRKNPFSQVMGLFLFGVHREFALMKDWIKS